MMKFVKENWNKLLLLAYAFLAPVISLAQLKPCDPTAGKICPIINQTSLNGLLKTLLTGVLKIGIPIVALAIIYCGFLFVSARGKPEAITKAKDALLYTLIGAAILLGSWAIAELISGTVLAL